MGFGSISKLRDGDRNDPPIRAAMVAEQTYRSSATLQRTKEKDPWPLTCF